MMMLNENIPFVNMASLVMSVVFKLYILALLLWCYLWQIIKQSLKAMAIKHLLFQTIPN